MAAIRRLSNADDQHIPEDWAGDVLVRLEDVLAIFGQRLNPNDPITTTGWLCPDCGFVYDITKLGHPMDSTALKAKWCRRLPLTEDDVKRGIYEKWGITCSCGQQTRWIPWGRR